MRFRRDGARPARLLGTMSRAIWVMLLLVAVLIAVPTLAAAAASSSSKAKAKSSASSATDRARTDKPGSTNPAPAAPAVPTHVLSDLFAPPSDSPPHQVKVSPPTTAAAPTSASSSTVVLSTLPLLTPKILRGLTLFPGHGTHTWSQGNSWTFEVQVLNQGGRQQVLSLRSSDPRVQVALVEPEGGSLTGKRWISAGSKSLTLARVVVLGSEERWVAPDSVDGDHRALVDLNQMRGANYMSGLNVSLSLSDLAALQLSARASVEAFLSGRGWTVPALMEQALHSSSLALARWTARKPVVPLGIVGVFSLSGRVELVLPEIALTRPCILGPHPSAGGSAQQGVDVVNWGTVQVSRPSTSTSSTMTPTRRHQRSIAVHNPSLTSSLTVQLTGPWPLPVRPGLEDEVRWETLEAGGMLDNDFFAPPATGIGGGNASSQQAGQTQFPFALSLSSPDFVQSLTLSPGSSGLLGPIVFRPSALGGGAGGGGGGVFQAMVVLFNNLTRVSVVRLKGRAGQGRLGFVSLTPTPKTSSSSAKSLAPGAWPPAQRMVRHSLSALANVSGNMLNSLGLDYALTSSRSAFRKSRTKGLAALLASIPSMPPEKYTKRLGHLNDTQGFELINYGEYDVIVRELRWTTGRGANDTSGDACTLSSWGMVIDGCDLLPLTVSPGVSYIFRLRYLPLLQRAPPDLLLEAVHSWGSTSVGIQLVLPPIMEDMMSRAGGGGVPPALGNRGVEGRMVLTTILALGVILCFVLRGPLERAVDALKRRIRRPRAHDHTLPPSSVDLDDHEVLGVKGSKKKKKAHKKGGRKDKHAANDKLLASGEDTDDGHANGSNSNAAVEVNAGDDQNVNNLATADPDHDTTADEHDDHDHDADSDDDNGKHVRFAPSEAMLRRAAKKAARKAAKLAASSVADTLSSLHTIPTLTPAALSSLDKLYRSPSYDPISASASSSVEEWPLGEARPKNKRTATATLPRVTPVDGPIWKAADSHSPAVVVTPAPISSPSSIPAPSLATSTIPLATVSVPPLVAVTAASSPVKKGSSAAATTVHTPTAVPSAVVTISAASIAAAAATASSAAAKAKASAATAAASIAAIQSPASSPSSTVASPVRGKPTEHPIIRMSNKHATTIVNARNSKAATTAAGKAGGKVDANAIANGNSSSNSSTPASTPIVVDEATAVVPSFSRNLFGDESSPLASTVHVAASAVTTSPFYAQSVAGSFVATSVTSSTSAVTVPSDPPRRTSIDLGLPILSPSIFAGFYATTTGASSDDAGRAILTGSRGVGVIGANGGSVGVIGGSGGGVGSGRRSVSGGSSGGSMDVAAASSGLPSSMFSFLKGDDDEDGVGSVHASTDSGDDDGGDLLLPSVSALTSFQQDVRRSSFTSSAVSVVGSSRPRAAWGEDDLDYDELVAEYEAFRQSPTAGIAEEVTMPAAGFEAPLSSGSTDSPLLGLSTLSSIVARDSSPLMSTASLTSSGVAHHPRPPMHLTSSASRPRSDLAAGVINPSLSVPHQWAYGSGSAIGSNNYLSPFSSLGLTTAALSNGISPPSHSPSASPHLPLSPGTSANLYSSMFAPPLSSPSESGGSGSNSAIHSPPHQSPNQSPPLHAQLAPGQSRSATLSPQQAQQSHLHHPVASHYSSYQPASNGLYTPLLSSSSSLPASTLSSLSSLTPQQVIQLQALLASAQAQASVSNISWDSSSPHSSPTASSSSGLSASAPIYTPTAAASAAATSAASAPITAHHTPSHSPTPSLASLHVQSQQQQTAAAWRQYVQQAQLYIEEQQRNQRAAAAAAAAAASSTTPPNGSGASR